MRSNHALLADLLAALDAALADEAVGALVLRGAGRAFCAGDDLKEIESQTAHEAATRAFIESIQAVTRRLVLGDKVVVGAIHGWAVGGGLEWAIDCDLAVFAESTRCFFPEIAWGMFPTGGVTAILPRIVGLAKTRELLLLGETFGAAQAHEMGPRLAGGARRRGVRDGTRDGGAHRRPAAGRGARPQAGAQPGGLARCRGRARAGDGGHRQALPRPRDSRAGEALRRRRRLSPSAGVPSRAISIGHFVFLLDCDVTGLPVGATQG